MNDSSNLGAEYPRLVRSQLEQALENWRVVWLGGPRQAGKTTLAKSVAQGEMDFVSLDQRRWRNLAISDPAAFLRKFDRVIIDEVQIAPDLIQEIKVEVDSDQRRGRYLLTGSADILTVPRIRESLVGRMVIQPLMPLSQAEIRGGNGTFLETVFAGGVPQASDFVLGPDLVELVLSGGFPEALRIDSWTNRQRWYTNYVEGLVIRDMPNIDNVEQPIAMQDLAETLPHFSGKTINYSKVGEILSMKRDVVKRYMRLLEQTYLFQTLPNFSTNKIKMLVRESKLFFLDSGLLANLLEDSPDTIASNRTAFGSITETFVFSELLKQTTWTCGKKRFFHLRTRDGKEVDIVVRNGAGKVVGIEVKAGKNVSTSDFSGLQALAEACGDSFIKGIILYDGTETRPYKDKFMALPISSLWC